MLSTFPDDASPCPVRVVPPGLVGIAGCTGIGKTRLISELLGVTGPKSAAGRPQTTDLHEYRRRNVGLGIVDSPGFEILNVAATFDLVRGDIRRRSASQDPDRQYYAFILCILEPGTRIQDSDREIHEMCRTLGIPLVIVLTKASEDYEGFSGDVRKAFPRVPVIRVNVGLQFRSRRVGIDELVTVLTQIVTRGRESVARRVAENEIFDNETDSMLRMAILRAQDIAVSAGKWCVGVPVPGASIPIIRNAEEKILAMVGDVFHIQLPDSLRIDMLTRWRAIARDEYLKLGALMAAQVGYVAVNFATCGISSVASVGLAKFGDKIGVDINKGFEAVRAFQPQRIVGMFASVVIHSLFEIRRESHERGERTPQYVTEVRNRLDNMFRQCNDSRYPELHWDG
jgi:GTP-binding protein EngB required for normal cell division